MARRSEKRVEKKSRTRKEKRSEKIENYRGRGFRTAFSGKAKMGKKKRKRKRNQK